MATKRRKSVPPASPLSRKRIRIGAIDAAGFVAKLRDLHEKAGDPHVETMPADDELYGALIYAEAHAGVLTPEAGAVAAVIRVRLWEYLRERTEIHQNRAIDDARGAGVEWKALVDPLAVTATSAAYSKYMRQRALLLPDAAPAGGSVRRTPEAVIAVQSRLAREAAAERHRLEVAKRRHVLVEPVARSLVTRRKEFVDDEDVSDWLDEIEAVLEDCYTPTQQVSLATYVKAVVRALRAVERHGRRPALTGEAERILAAAVALFT
jgi:hypothetical protein